MVRSERLSSGDQECSIYKCVSEEAEKGEEFLGQLCIAKICQEKQRKPYCFVKMITLKRSTVVTKHWAL